jgi:hypothetical protein
MEPYRSDLAKGAPRRESRLWLALDITKSAHLDRKRSSYSVASCSPDSHQFGCLGLTRRRAMRDATLRPSRDALQRAIDQRGRFASLTVAFTMPGPSVVFYIADLVGVQWAALSGMFYLDTVVWAFTHERELQHQAEDMRAEREAVSTVLTVIERCVDGSSGICASDRTQTVPENVRTRQPSHRTPRRKRGSCRAILPVALPTLQLAEALGHPPIDTPHPPGQRLSVARPKTTTAGLAPSPRQILLARYCGPGSPTCSLPEC